MIYLFKVLLIFIHDDDKLELSVAFVPSTVTTNNPTVLVLCRISTTFSRSSIIRLDLLSQRYC